jgi:hypothetical protein
LWWRCAAERKEDFMLRIVDATAAARRVLRVARDERCDRRRV